MDQNKINKIAVIALIFSLFSLSGQSGLSGVIYNYYNNTTYNYTNASIDYDLKNYTNTYQWVNNSTMASDNLKVNRSNDNLSMMYFDNNTLNNISYINSTGGLKLYNAGTVIEGGRTDYTRNFDAGGNAYNSTLTIGFGSVNIKGSCGNGCGATNFIRTGDNSIYLYVGKWGMYWDDRTIGSSNIFFMTRKNIADSAATALIFTGFGANQSVMFEGNISAKSLIGVGDRAVCVHADGKLFAC